MKITNEVSKIYSYVYNLLNSYIPVHYHPDKIIIAIRMYMMQLISCEEVCMHAGWDVRCVKQSMSMKWSEHTEYHTKLRILQLPQFELHGLHSLLEYLGLSLPPSLSVLLVQFGLLA